VSGCVHMYVPFVTVIWALWKNEIFHCFKYWKVGLKVHYKCSKSFYGMLYIIEFYYANGHVLSWTFFWHERKMILELDTKKIISTSMLLKFEILKRAFMLSFRHNDINSRSPDFSC
jgi:hypothetical protein